MKQGKYFRIPEGPADLEQLWGEAEALVPARLPEWLTPEDAAASFELRFPFASNAAGDARVDSTSSRASDFGNTFHCRGDSIFSVGS